MIAAKIFKKSRKIHKYLGLFLLLFLTWMAISGIILNHPKMIKNASVSKSIVPKSYHPNNWNRSSMKGVVSVENLGNVIYGNQGVYLEHNGKITSQMSGEFPQSARGKRTNHLVYDKPHSQLWAATNDGLFSANISDMVWNRYHIISENSPILKILKHNDSTILVGDSFVLVAESTNKLFHYSEMDRLDDDSTTLIEVFFKLHSGSIFGMPGIILWDIAGLVLVFLSVSAFYIWFYPKRWKRRAKKNKSIKDSEKKNRSFFLRFHKKLGWYFALILLIIVGTGIFMRPPLIVALLDKEVPKLSKLINHNPWHHKIRNAMFDVKTNQLILDCKDGFWRGNPYDNNSFERFDVEVDLFAMGATVLENTLDGHWVIGSFGNLDVYDPISMKSESVLVEEEDKSSARPAATMVTAYVNFNGIPYVLGHNKGLCNAQTQQPVTDIPMPDEIRENYRMPLWNFMFELHNGRLFRGAIGSLYILVVPLGGLLSLLVLLSGIFDFWWSRRKPRKQKGA